MIALKKNLSDYSLAWKLLLVPVVATLSFAAYLVYSSIVLSDGEYVLIELRDIDYPILDEAEKNLNAYGRVVDALEAAVATGEEDFLDIAKEKANEITSSYGTLEKLDTAHKHEITKMNTEFNTYFALALDIAQRMAARKDMPSSQQLMKMKDLRDAYFSETRS